MPKVEVCVHKKTGKCGAIVLANATGSWTKREKAEFNIYTMDVTKEDMKAVRLGKKKIADGKLVDVPEAEWPKEKASDHSRNILDPMLLHKIREGVASGVIGKEAIEALVSGRIKTGKKTKEAYIPRGVQDPRPGI